MSPREKRLIILFALAGFFILNLLGYKLYASLRQDAEGALNQAKIALQGAEVASSNRDSVAPAMEWLETHLPRPADYQTVQSALQNLAETEATNAGLTVRSQRLLDPDQTSTHFHKVKVQLALTGTEQALYRWITSLNAPDKIRSVTRLLLSPNKENDSLIDCTADVEQWFTPAATES